MSKPSVAYVAPAPAAADVGLVMALPIEAGYLCDNLKRVRKYAARSHTIIEGELGGRVIAVVLSGMGRSAARRGAEILLAGHRPRYLASAGFAAGLDPTLARNEVILPHEVVDPDGNHTPIPGLGASFESSLRRGRLLTVDRIITRVAEKAQLRSEHLADLLDMETSAVAILARERNLDFLAVRVISDEAAVELPEEVGRLLAHTGSYRVGAAFRAIWQRPAALKDFWSLHARAMESADRLAGILERMVKALPGPV